ncbi:MAG: hypothetical protein AAF957_25850 [Planctomycetota bacterium]
MRSLPIPFAAAAVLAVACALTASCSGEDAPAPPSVLDPVLPRTYRSIELRKLGIWSPYAYASHEGGSAKVQVGFMTGFEDDDGESMPPTLLAEQVPVRMLIGGEEVAPRSEPPPGPLVTITLSMRATAGADYEFDLPEAARRDDPPSYQLVLELDGERTTLTMRPEEPEPGPPREYRSDERPSLGIWTVQAYARHEGATAEVAVKFRTTYGRDTPFHSIEGDAPSVEAVIAGEVAALRSAPPPGVLTMTALSGTWTAHADYVFDLPAAARREDPPSYDLSVALDGERATLTMRLRDPGEEPR